MTIAPAHRVTHRTKYGALETLRVFGAPDCDSAACYVADLFESKVTAAEPVDRDTPRVYGEMDWEGTFEHA